MLQALAQIVVTSEPVGNEREYEQWATYYDIFVHHAFGNYRDILREVSASPLMAVCVATNTATPQKTTAHKKWPSTPNLLHLCWLRAFPTPASTGGSHRVQ